MSVHVTKPVWLMDIRPAAKKLVALRLADASSDEGVCWPSVATIAKFCGVNPRLVRRYVSEMEKDGLIERVSRERADGSSTSNQYQWRLEKLDEVEEKDRETRSHTPRIPVSSPPDIRILPPLALGSSPPDPGVLPSEASVEPSKEASENGKAMAPTPTPPKPRASRPSKVEASPEEKAIIQAVAKVYAARFRGVYVPDPKHDVPAARQLLLAGLTAEEVGRVFDRATRTKGFWCSKVMGLPDLARRWNDVQGEIGKAAPVGRQEQTAEEWASELKGEPK